MMGVKYGINRVTLVGNLAADPELRATGNGTPVCNLRIAVTEPGFNGGEDVTSWHDVVAWAGLAEAASRLRKGAAISVEGAMQTRSWEKDGAKHYRTEVKATFIGAPLEDEPRGQRQGQRDEGQRPAPRGHEQNRTSAPPRDRTPPRNAPAQRAPRATY